jgi:transcriptional regulator with XRE-family HTH domain
MAKSKRPSLADQLRQAIDKSGITMYKLSQDSGVDRSQLSRFMRGERDMSLVVSDKICQVLGLRFCKSEDGDR